MPSSTNIAHISDLHFGTFCLDPLQFFSKRWVGNANLIFNRRSAFTPERIQNLSHTFKEKGVEGVIITGDFTTTSLDAEYTLARDWVKQLEKAGMWTIVLPGNHDHYTTKASKTRRFYDFFESSSHLKKEGDYSLRENGMEVFKIDYFWVVVLDTTLATPLFSASGYFSPELEEELAAFLSERSSSDIVLLCNHFPFFNTGNPRNFLKRGEALEALLKDHPCVKIYLHGHNHRNCIADLRKSSLPIILDSGSISFNRHSSWNLLQLSTLSCEITPFIKEGANEEWDAGKTHEFTWVKR